MIKIELRIREFSQELPFSGLIFRLAIWSVYQATFIDKNRSVPFIIVFPEPTILRSL